MSFVNYSFLPQTEGKDQGKLHRKSNRVEKTLFTKHIKVSCILNFISFLCLPQLPHIKSLSNGSSIQFQIQLLLLWAYANATKSHIYSFHRCWNSL